MLVKEQENVNEKYNIFFDMKITNEIGKGAFGYVYCGKNVKTGEEYAIKIDKKVSKHSQIEQEKKIYQKLESKSNYLNYLNIYIVYRKIWFS